MWYLLIGILSGVFIYYKIIKPAKFWEERGVIHEPAWPIVGNFLDTLLRRKHPVTVISELYQKHFDKRYVGYLQFTYPFLMVRDLDLIKRITVKDFDSFHDHWSSEKNLNDPFLAKSLPMLTGSDWRRMRATLSPAFTTNKMKNMYQLMSECAENFVGHFKGKEQVAVEMKDIFSRFTTDVIATTAFGIKVNSLNEPNNQFFTMGKSFSKFGFTQRVKMAILLLFTSLAKVLGIRFFPKELTDFFQKIIKKNIEDKVKNGIVRPDLIHLLLEARKGCLNHESNAEINESFALVKESQLGKSTNQVELTDDDIVAQAVLFFLAGFNTASTASCFMAYELAIHPDIQKRLQEEIDIVNQTCNGKVSYETLLSMRYLDQVLCESLRMWPPGFLIERLCTKEYKIEAKANEKEVVLEKGSSITIPVIGIHRDSQYYSEPERFNPERFSEENRSKIVPGSYLPFGIGPRNCIASRFALLEIKTLFFYLLSKFDIVAIDSTEIPLRISPKKIDMEPENGFRLGFRPRKTTLL